MKTALCLIVLAAAAAVSAYATVEFARPLTYEPANTGITMPPQTLTPPTLQSSEARSGRILWTRNNPPTTLDPNDPRLLKPSDFGNTQDAPVRLFIAR